LVINNIIKKIDTIVKEPKKPNKIFLTLKFKAKYKNDKKNIIKKMFPVGVCFVKKEIAKTIGKKNQYILEFVFKANIKISKEIIESIEA